MSDDPLKPDRHIEVHKGGSKAKKPKAKAVPEKLEVKADAPKRAAQAPAKAKHETIEVHKPMTKKAHVKVDVGEIEIKQRERKAKPLKTAPEKIELASNKPARKASPAQEKSGKVEVRKPEHRKATTTKMDVGKIEVETSKPHAKATPAKATPPALDVHSAKAAQPKAMATRESRSVVKHDKAGMTVTGPIKRDHGVIETRKASAAQPRRTETTSDTIELAERERHAARAVSIDHGDIELVPAKPGAGPRAEAAAGDLDIQAAKAGHGPRFEPHTGKTEVHAARPGAGPRAETDHGEVSVQNADAKQPTPMAVRRDDPVVHKPTPSSGPTMDTTPGEITIDQAKAGEGPRMKGPTGSVEIQAAGTATKPTMAADHGSIEVQRVKPDAVAGLANLSRPRDVDIRHDESHPTDTTPLESVKKAAMDVRIDSNSVWTPRAMRRNQEEE